ncbi:hypothetical protein N7527_004793 [Penicillium freii]|nr:hypothetical protein N7527_004793 [Penicillium freii]
MIHQYYPRDEEEDDLVIHYGLIASANQLIKDARTRDKLAAEKGVLCFEIEVAGLMNHFPCLVIYSVCDYADTYKNKVQQTSYEIKADTHTIRAYSTGFRLPTLLPMSTMQGNLGTLELEYSSLTKLGLRKYLWLYRMPGCGKTVLSAAILDHIKQTKVSATLNFFFDFTDTRKQKVDDILRSLAFQLYCSQPESQQDLDTLFMSYDNRQRQLDNDSLSICLKGMMRAYKKLFIILDALDECSKRSELLVWMEKFIPTLLYIQLIATSRPEGEIKRNLHE